MFKAIKSFFGKVAKLFITPEGQKRVNDALAKAYDVMQIALPICEMIASATPTRTDDEVLDLVRSTPSPRFAHGPPAVGHGEGKHVAVCRHFFWSAAQLVNLGVPANVIDHGVQLAYSSFMADQVMSPDLARKTAFALMEESDRLDPPMWTE